MMTKYYLLSPLLCLLLFLTACTDEEAQFTPTQRKAERNQALALQLREQPRGWMLTYFSRMDSLLFVTPKLRIGHREYRDRYGYGGHCFALHFDEGEQLRLWADFDATTARTPSQGAWNIGFNTTTQLSFTLFSYLHRLANDTFQGSSDFLFQGVNRDGQYLFTTATYTHPGHEYIRLEPIPEGETPQTVMEKSLSNRQLFEQMVNPQLLVKDGERIIYRSSYYLKRRVPTNLSFIEEIERKRYYVFLSPNTTDEFTISQSSYRGFSALGSGYVGTLHGLTFRPGLAATASVIVHDFERVGNKFVCELVQVYDPIVRKRFLKSKHLHPEGEYTGYTAEIWDAGHQE